MREFLWTFLTLHARVLIYLTNHSEATCREIAQEAGVTERAVQKIIHDLVEEGYVVRRRAGRGNAYIVHPELPMRHAMEREHAVGDLLRALGSTSGEDSTKSVEA